MTPEQLVMRLIEEETARLNAVLDAQLAEVEVAARGTAHLKRTQEIVEGFRARVNAIRAAQIDKIECELRRGANLLN